VELVSRMMDGSISYDPKARLEPVSSGATVKQGDKVERLKEVRMFEECSQRQLRSIASIARVFDAPAGTMLTRADEPGDEFFLILDGSASVDVATEKSEARGNKGLAREEDHWQTPQGPVSLSPRL